MSEQALTVRQESALEELQPAENLMSVIQRAALDPNFDVTKMERLVGLYERITAEQKKTAFMAAMARLQEKLPQIDKYGQGKNSKFAKLEDIDAVVRPMLAEEGFSLSFDEESHTDKTITFVAWLSHRDGHREPRRLTVPIDAAARNSQGNSVRPAIQDAGSTVSYARRYLIKMHLNIIEKDEDNDGAGPVKVISDEQVKDIEAAIHELKMDRGRFLLFMGVGDVCEILERDLKKAGNAIDVQRRSIKK